ncbi:hypothetical protein TSAR_011830 [Trichomalopsis sarcophagae]|uniref:Ionotropic glutamate receptor C-terminal domain-containing protein n=1 Tax=Trichomalopsis sarcophagae TaxID=543379 RepID=A0A232F5H7_9HYME|nr:hypothetical protein TSAR_011830 [Trichomalopsis sarcophagae]
MPEVAFIKQEVAYNLMDSLHSDAEETHFCRLRALRDLMKTPNENMNTSNDLLDDFEKKSKKKMQKEDFDLLNDVVDFYCPTCKKKGKNPEYFVRGDLRCGRCFTRQKFSCRIIKAFPSLVIDTEELIDRKLELVLSQPSERMFLKVIFAISEDNKSAVQELIEKIEFLVNIHVESMRPKCLILLVNDPENSDLLEFFKYSWTYKFLDVTVIEIPKDTGQRHSLRYSIPTNLEIAVHRYNPFIHSYKKERFNSDEELFPDKLRNLYGFNLKSGYFEEILSVMKKSKASRNSWNSLFGFGVYLSNFFARTLNFTIDPHQIDEKDLHVLDNNHLDFLNNFYYTVGFSSTKELIGEPTRFIHRASVHVIVRELGYYNAKISKNLAILIAVLAAFFASLLLSIRLMRFDRKIWTTMNVTTIVLGKSIHKLPAGSTQRVFFIFLSFTSFTCLANFLAQSLTLYLHQEVFANINTIQEVIKYGIVPSISEFTRTHVLTEKNQYILEKLLSTSKTLRSIADIETCIERLIDEDDKDVEGCEVSSFLGKAIAENYVRENNPWVVRFVDEPLGVGWAVMLMTKTSPYVEKFNRLLGHLFDSGIMEYWKAKSARGLVFTHKKFFERRLKCENIPLIFKHIRKKNIILSSGNITFILGFGFFISSFAFVCELFWPRFAKMVMMYAHKTVVTKIQ